MDEGEYFKNMYDYIGRLPKEDKVSDGIYEQRLRVCKGCDHLLSGMCRICGCYVEMRAAMRIKSCPDTRKRWDACV
jgi:hypothetical protein